MKNGNVLSIDDEARLAYNFVEQETPKGGAQPSSQPPRWVLFHKLAVVKNFVQDELANGVIIPNKSTWSKPLVLVRIKDGETRFCVDFRQLNESTVGNSFQIPRIVDSLDALGKAKFLPHLTYPRAIGKSWSKKQTVQKLPLHIIKGLFEFNTMPFGLKGPQHHSRG